MPPGRGGRASGLTGEVEVLDRRALNRALLARQFLLQRTQTSAFEVIEHLVGMQAQVPTDPYLGLWTRLDGFEPAEVEELLLARRVARSPLMRTTLHLATARDCVALRALVQPVMERTQRSTFGRRLAGADVDALVTTGRALLAEKPRTLAELRKLLGDAWSGYDPAAVGYSVSYLVPLVQVPPRGLWSRSGLPTWTTTEAWLGTDAAGQASLEELVTRYLRAFGPATVQDIHAWCGLTGLKAVVDGIRSQFLVFKDERGRELIDLPEAPRPDPGTHAPVRFLPEYDNVFLSHADRSRIVANTTRTWAARTGAVRTLLVDGFMAGSWKLTTD